MTQSIPQTLPDMIRIDVIELAMKHGQRYDQADGPAYFEFSHDQLMEFAEDLLSNDVYRTMFLRLAKILNCLPSTYPDANDHVIREAERYVGLACKICNGHGLVGCMTMEGGEGHECPDCHGTGAALAAQPPAVAAIPEGWKLVPMKATREMLNAAIDVDAFKLGDISPLGFRMSPQQLFEKCYEAMLAQVTQPPAGQQGRGEAIPEGYAHRVIDELYENGDPVSIDAAELLTQMLTAHGWRPMTTAPTSRPIILLWRTAPWPLRGEWSIDEEFDTRPKGWVSPESGWRNDGDQCIPRNQEDCIGWQELPAISGNAKAVNHG